MHIITQLTIMNFQRSYADPGSPGGHSPGYPGEEDTQSHTNRSNLAPTTPHNQDYPPVAAGATSSSVHGDSTRGSGQFPPDATTPRSTRSGAGFATPAREDLFPVPPRASLNQSEYTDQWVEQAATNVATGTAIPPPQTPMHNEEFDNDDYYLNDGDEGGEGLDDDEQMMGEDETIESFEDRVLNKRAAQLHRLATIQYSY